MPIHCLNVIVRCHILVKLLSRENFDFFHGHIVSTCGCTFVSFQSDAFFLVFCQRAFRDPIAYALLLTVIYKVILCLCRYCDLACCHDCLHGCCDRLVVRYGYTDLYRCTVRYVRYLRHLAPVSLFTEPVLYRHVFCRDLFPIHSCDFDAGYRIVRSSVIHSIVTCCLCFHKLQVFCVRLDLKITCDICYFIVTLDLVPGCYQCVFICAYRFVFSNSRTAHFVLDLILIQRSCYGSTECRILMSKQLLRIVACYCYILRFNFDVGLYRLTFYISINHFNPYIIFTVIVCSHICIGDFIFRKLDAVC